MKRVSGDLSRSHFLSFSTTADRVDQCNHLFRGWSFLYFQLADESQSQLDSAQAAVVGRTVIRDEHGARAVFDMVSKPGQPIKADPHWGLQCFGLDDYSLAALSWMVERRWTSQSDYLACPKTHVQTLGAAKLSTDWDDEEFIWTTTS